MYDKKQAIINSWINFSKNENKNLSEFVNWCSYYFSTSKDYVRSVLAEYNLAENQKKREEQEKELKEAKKFLDDLMEEL